MTHLWIMTYGVFWGFRPYYAFTYTVVDHVLRVVAAGTATLVAVAARGCPNPPHRAGFRVVAAGAATRYPVIIAAGRGGSCPLACPLYLVAARCCYRRYRLAELARRGRIGAPTRGPCAGLSSPSQVASDALD